MAIYFRQSLIACPEVSSGTWFTSSTILTVAPLGPGRPLSPGIPASPWNNTKVHPWHTQEQQIHPPQPTVKPLYSGSHFTAIYWTTPPVCLVTESFPCAGKQHINSSFTVWFKAHSAKLTINVNEGDTYGDTWLSRGTCLSHLSRTALQRKKQHSIKDQFQRAISILSRETSWKTESENKGTVLSFYSFRTKKRNPKDI